MKFSSCVRMWYRGCVIFYVKLTSASFHSRWLSAETSTIYILTSKNGFSPFAQLTRSTVRHSVVWECEYIGCVCIPLKCEPNAFVAFASRRRRHCHRAIASLLCFCLILLSLQCFEPFDVAWFEAVRCGKTFKNATPTQHFHTEIIMYEYRPPAKASSFCRIYLCQFSHRMKWNGASGRYQRSER